MAKERSTEYDPQAEMYPRAAVVFICHDGEGNILMARRGGGARNEHGKWDFGSGAIEHGQAALDTVARELAEEYGVKDFSVDFLGYRDVIGLESAKGAHWVVLDFLVRLSPSDVRGSDSDEVEELGWFHIDNLPRPLHTNTSNILRRYSDLLQSVGIRSTTK